MHNLIEARSYLLTIQIQETPDELSRIDAEMDAISGKIVTRARQLNADVMTTRTDPIISDLWRALCRYHRKAMVLCEGMGNSRPQICAKLVKPQACIEALHLSEEFICCEVFRRKVQQMPKERRKVKYAMSSPVVTIDEESTAAELVRLLREHQIGSAIVLHNGETRGIVTERDLVSKIFEHLKPLKDTLVKTIMTRAPLVTIDAEAELQSAAETMSRNSVRHLPVIDNGHLVGMLAIPDFYRDAPIQLT